MNNYVVMLKKIYEAQIILQKELKLALSLDICQ